MQYKLRHDVLETEVAIEKYGVDFWEQNDVGCGGGCEVYILLQSGEPVAWYLFSVGLEYSQINPEYIVGDTGIYVMPGHRGKGLGKYLMKRFVRYLDQRLGRSNYIFDSIVVTRKGKAISQYRDSLTGNPTEHENEIVRLFNPTY